NGDKAFFRLLADALKKQSEPDVQSDITSHDQKPFSETDMIARIFVDRPVQLTHRDTKPDTILTGEPPAKKRKLTVSIAWSDLGLDSDSKEAQAFRNTLNTFKKKNPEYFSSDTSHLQMMEQIKSMEPDVLLLMLHKTFTDPRSDKSIARILELVALLNPDIIMPTSASLLAHAKRIQDFDTEKLLPNEAYKADGDAILSADEHQSNVLEDKKVKTHGGSDLNLKKPTGKDEEQKTFPCTRLDITRYLLTVMTDFHNTAKERHFSLNFPMGQGQFVKIDARLSTFFVDAQLANRHVFASQNRGIPQFDELNILKLIALKNFEGKYHLNEKGLKKALKLFNECYDQAKQKYNQSQKRE
ncbi:MAG: hypothetical protein AAB508_05325, partial [Patescibacteria group bacterium]